jgi:hypothetical protein
MDALMRLMRQMHHDPVNASMFDAEALLAFKLQPTACALSVICR